MNGNVTKQFVARLAAVVVALLVLGGAVLFGTSLYQGTTTVPDAVVAQIWTTVLSLVGVGAAALIAYINMRSNAALLKHNEQIADRIRAHSDANAQQTQVRVEKLITDVNDGLISKIAENTTTLVGEDNDRRAEALRITQEAAAAVAESQRLAAQVAADSQAIQQVLALLTKQSAPPDVATGMLATKVDQIIAGQADAAATLADTKLTQIETNTADTVQAIKEASKPDVSGPQPTGGTP